MISFLEINECGQESVLSLLFDTTELRGLLYNSKGEGQ